MFFSLILGNRPGKPVSRPKLYLGDIICGNNTTGNPPCDAAKIVRTTIHRVSVGVLTIRLHLVCYFVWVLSMNLKGFHGFCLRGMNCNLGWLGGVLVQVSNLHLVIPALIRCSAVLVVGATLVDLHRLEIQKRATSVIDMVTEFSTSEPEDMEGALAGRCNFLAQQQAMRFYVDLEMIWLDFVSRRPMPLEDEETTILQLYSITERLTNVFQKHSAEAFWQINDGIDGFLACDALR